MFDVERTLRWSTEQGVVPVGNWRRSRRVASRVDDGVMKAKHKHSGDQFQFHFGESGTETSCFT